MIERHKPTFWQEQARPGVVLLVIALLAYPWLVNEFFAASIGGYSLILGTIALSLMLLAGYGGMVSLAQLTVAGFAGYMMAIFGGNSAGVHGLGWPWWVLVPAAILASGVVSALIGAIAVRTEGIYTIMITLAIGVAFFLFARQNYVIFNGFTGFAGIEAPEVFGLNWLEPKRFYYLCLAMAALFFYAVLYASRSTFGLALQATRDNARRMQALGFNVTAIRIYAYFLSGIAAGTAGILLVWFNGRISPGSVGVDVAIDILVIAVIGGMRHPIGPYIGAIAFVLLENFAIDLIDRERFNTVIGIAFLLIVFLSPDGLLGLWDRIKSFFKPTNHRPGSGRPQAHETPAE